MKPGYFFKHHDQTYQYIGKVEHKSTGEVLAVLKSFKQGKTYVMNHTEFEWLVETEEYKREVIT